MKKWALLVVFLYLLILLVLTWPVTFSAFYGEISGTAVLGIYSSGLYWAVISVMVLAESALLMVSVKVANRRPVTRQSLLPVVAVSGFMMGVLALGLLSSLEEYLGIEPADSVNRLLSLSVGMGVWLLWAFLFYRISRRVPAQDLVSKQCRYLLRGSILELLIAVPTHIFVRQKNDCCAGFGTFFGIAMGLSVMLFSFGPGIFFLFVDRWKKLRPKAS